MINRLSKIYELQLIDDQLDELEELRGDLPLTVNELTSEINAKKELIDEKEEAKENALTKRAENDEEVERLTTGLKKFKAQLYKVRNNKEYDALTKEIEHSEKLIGELEEESIDLENLIETLKADIAEMEPALEELRDELSIKETELKKIIKQNEKEEAVLNDKRGVLAENIRKGDYNSYCRIRKAKAGKGIVTISRGACAGCHSVIPSQRQLEIKANNRLFTCEACGRLLVSAEIAKEVESKI